MDQPESDTMNEQARLQAAIADGTHIMILRSSRGRNFNRFAEWRTQHEPDGSMLLIADLEDGTSITKRIPAEHVLFFIRLVAINHAIAM